LAFFEYLFCWLFSLLDFSLAIWIPDDYIRILLYSLSAVSIKSFVWKCMEAVQIQRFLKQPQKSCGIGRVPSNFDF